MLLIDVPSLEPSRKHPYIFEQFKMLAGGESLRILNDHDPKPLYYQMVAMLGEVFNWKYVKSEPKEWMVEIRKLLPGQKPETVGEIAAVNEKKLQVFKKHGIDFCCGGGKTLHEVCMEKGLDVQRIQNELDAVEKAAHADVDHDCNCMRLDVLADFIETKHHTYLRNTLPELEAMARKVRDVHVQDHPFLSDLYNIIFYLADELTMHMQKEEMVLFPYIRSLQQAASDGKPLGTLCVNSVLPPITMMRYEHDDAGQKLLEIRTVTNDLKLPEAACATFTELYRVLAEFENDLMEHIHRENNILFPKALELEKKLKDDLN